MGATGAAAPAHDGEPWRHDGGAKEAFPIPEPIPTSPETERGLCVRAGASCYLCEQPIHDGDRVVVYHDTRFWEQALVYHAACWQEQNGCSVYGCASRDAFCDGDELIQYVRGCFQQAEVGGFCGIGDVVSSVCDNGCVDGACAP